MEEAGREELNPRAAVLLETALELMGLCTGPVELTLQAEDGRIRRWQPKPGPFGRNQLADFDDRRLTTS